MPRRRTSTKGLRPVLSDRGIWYAVGSVAGKRVRTSLRTRDESKAAELCAAYEARLWKRHTYGEAAVRTFEEAALSYLETGGRDGQGGDGRFLPPLLTYFKGRNIGSITGGEIRDAAVALYPKASAATRNRQGIVPARAVIIHAHGKGWCGLVRVKQFVVVKSRKHKPVDRSWLDAFMAEADASGLPHLSALVLFMHRTAARVGEAVRLMGEHVDLEQRVAVLEKTKTEPWSVRGLTAELAMRIGALSPREGFRVFGYTDPKAVNRVMRRVCERAGIPYRSTHSAGRHSFGTNAVKVGIKEAMDAGGWKSAKLFLETYVHSSEAVASVTAHFDAETPPHGNIWSKPEKRRLGSARKR